MQIQISWLLHKPTDLDLHCLQRKAISGLCRTRVNTRQSEGQLYSLLQNDNGAASKFKAQTGGFNCDLDLESALLSYGFCNHLTKANI